MKIKVITWNIGGGKILAKNSDPNKLASYSEDGFNHIIEILKNENPDIITLQETHKNEFEDLVGNISKALGFDFYKHDSTSPSHIDSKFNLGHAIISRYPIDNHTSGFFNNPKLNVVWEDGSIAQSFDKGFSTVVVSVDGQAINITTTHLVPFRRFKVDVESEVAKTILKDVQEKIKIMPAPWIISGDFNINSKSLKDYLPRLLANMTELDINEPTTPKGSYYDHIIFRGVKLMECHVLSNVVTDHYPVVATFEL